MLRILNLIGKIKNNIVRFNFYCDILIPDYDNKKKIACFILLVKNKNKQLFF